MIFSAVAILLFPLLMAFAASSDLLTMRISNVLVGVLVLSYFAVALILQVPLAEIGQNLLVAGITLVVGFAFFAFRWVGGGDAKLAAATMLWIGLGELLPYLVYAALLGGALTMAVIAIRRWPLPAPVAKWKWLDRLHDSKSGVPYGIALAVAGIIVYTDTAIFRHLAA
jgi:prepilin peptidase CpaA